MSINNCFYGLNLGSISKAKEVLCPNYFIIFVTISVEQKPLLWRITSYCFSLRKNAFENGEG